MLDNTIENFVVIASGFILTESLPDNFYEMEEAELLALIADTVTQDYEHWEECRIYMEIEYLAQLLQETYERGESAGYASGLAALNV